MRLFISWSKEPSRTIAVALRDWLPDILQSLEPWMSSADIGAGARWSAEIAGALSKAKIGIICVTAENQQEPWLLFEAGALAKTLEETFVCPYLIHMRQSDLVPGPLTQFQSKIANKDGTFDLVSTVNRALGTEALPDERLRRLFDRSWPDLDAKLSVLPASKSGRAANRDQSEILSEVLETVRSLSRRIPETPPGRSPEERARMVRIKRESELAHRLSKLGMPDTADAPSWRHLLRTMSDAEFELLRKTLYQSCDPPKSVQEVAKWLNALEPKAEIQGESDGRGTDRTNRGIVAE